MTPRTFAIIAVLSFTGIAARAQPERVLVVVNDSSPDSRAIGQYYTAKRAIPAANVCHLKTFTEEEIERDVYDYEIAKPIAACLKKRNLSESIYYIVTTLGLPLKITGEGHHGTDAEFASVDSELTLLYRDQKTGKTHDLRGALNNPFYDKRNRPFTHPEFPIYLVTRLAAYDLAGVKAMIDRSLQAQNRGKFVFDSRSPDDTEGDDWLRNAAIALPRERVLFDETTKPVYDQSDVIGYASFGSNDPNITRRSPGFHWLPGAIIIEYVSSDGRTFARPPANWKTDRHWNNKGGWFDGSPQSLSADYIAEGATGASGHVFEPYLILIARPNIVFPAYFSGRNLAESYYLGMPGLSWQNIVIGDPLCTLGPPTQTSRQ